MPHKILEISFLWLKKKSLFLVNNIKNKFCLYLDIPRSHHGLLLSKSISVEFYCSNSGEKEYERI